MSISGCASLPLNNPIVDEVQYLQTALESTPLQRLQMWNAIPEQPRNAEQRMRKAMLLSVPGHPAYNPDSARTQLGQIAEEFPRSHGVLAKARIAEMRVLQNCHTQVIGLQKQLDAVADIERDLEGEVR